MSGAQDRLRREATFWLRPGFVLRVLRRFTAIEGFDRAMALSSSAFTALIPLTILSGVILPWTDPDRTAEKVVRRFELSGAGADAIREAFAPPDGVETSLGLIGAFFVLVAVLSFSRALQRMVERTWELPPMSLRNTRQGLLWTLGLAGYGVLTGWISYIDPDTLVGLVVRGALLLPLSAVFWMWTGRTLSGRRVAWTALLPFAVTTAIAITIYNGTSDLWLPALFDSYTARYGVIGATFAFLSWLFAMMFVVVCTAALGREVHDELEAIGSGRRVDEATVGEEWRRFRAELAERRAELDATLARWRERRRSG